MFSLLSAHNNSPRFQNKKNKTLPDSLLDHCIIAIAGLFRIDLISRESGNGNIGKEHWKCA